ncbi:hypothetical protein Tco_1438446 [Tanacetum coccineum]
MAEQQTINYAPQWNNMNVDNVTFQTNNVVGNFNYLPNVPACKPIMKFLLNCPLNIAFTNYPSVVYQNFLREFWSTAVAYDHFPSTNETEQCPLREFLIKFSVLNGQRPLTLDFNTFCSSTGLDYNNGKYVAHPTPKVLSGNYSSTGQVNSIQQLLAYCLITGTEIDIEEIIYSDLVLPGIPSNSNFTKDPSKVTDIELTAHMIDVNNKRDLVSPLPLSAKPKKGKSQTVTQTLPKSQGPEASGALSKKRQKPKSKKPPTKTKGTRKSQPLPEGTATHPKDSGGNIEPLDMDLTSTTSDEGTAKTTPRPEGSLRDKDSGGNIPPADMEPIHPTVADLSGTGAKYQVDETQSTRLRYRSLTKNKGKTSSEVEPDTEPLQLQTFADVQVFILFEDELDKESDEEKTPSPKQDQPEPSHVQESTSDSSTPDLKKFNNTLPLNERQLIKYLRKVSRVLFSRITKKQWEQHEEAAISYVDLKASIEEYYDENVAQIDQTDKLVETTDMSSTTIKDLYQGLNVITTLLKDINTAVKDDPATNKKIVEAIETFAKISTNTTEVLSLVKDFDFSTLQSTVKDLQAHALKQEEVSAAWTKSSTNMAWNLGSRMTAIEISQTALKSEVSSLRQDTSEIKCMMIEIYQAFKV